jgi:hypothetical protein
MMIPSLKTNRGTRLVALSISWERAVAYGPMAALDDRPRSTASPGYPQGWRVLSTACRQAAVLLGKAD